MRDPDVIESWRRCIDQHKLDPAARQKAHVVTESRLREHRQEAERLVHIARGGLDRLFRQVAGQRYVVLLTDRHGVAVDYFGERHFESELRQAGLYLGAHWEEGLSGTSAAGACIQTGEAVTIHQDDHFDLMHTPLSCTAAPIFDTTGSLAAVLDISLLRSPRPKSSQRLAMQLVTASARRVELANLMARSASEWVLRFSLSPELLDVDPDAAVTLDGSGRIIGFTHGAARVLTGVAGVDWRTPEVLVGQSITRFFNLDINQLPGYMRGRPAEERILQFVDGSPVFAHAIAPQPSVAANRSPSLSPRRVRGNPLNDLHGGDDAMLEVQRLASRLVESTVPVCIQGESGSGRRHLARAMHDSRTPAQRFRVLSCIGLVPAMIDSGQWLKSIAEDTGTGNPGIDGGSLYIEELADLQPVAQDALMRLLVELDDNDRNVGTVRTIPRLLCSSRISPIELVKEGRFRADLLHRLVGATLVLPALRHRQDFDWLLQRVLQQRCQTDPPAYRFTRAAQEDLAARRWSGNLRELANVVDVAIALCPGGVIEVEHLPPALGDSAAATEPNLRNPGDLPQLLESCQWNISRVARMLGVNRSTVHRRMQRAGLQRPD
ncbi:sigma-54-dependent Fis family transcriptional regulator [Granulosicoccus sp. 3-233]|uniref:sigma-54-dependent Fis family transcriptional regulator n=1 Tax=Granulosicoccus sp. 3-233 TaxID=3417969 RepID=UPI003D356FA5